MFEVGWLEMLVIAIVMIVVVGPKDLPKMLRSFGRFTTKARKMAGDFQRQFSEALEEAELKDVKDAVDQVRGLNPKTAIKKHLNPFEQAAGDIRAGLKSLDNPTPKDAPSEPHPAEPLKVGPVAAEPAPAPAARKPRAAKPAAAKAAAAKPAPAKASEKAKAPAAKAAPRSAKDK